MPNDADKNANTTSANVPPPLPRRESRVFSFQGVNHNLIACICQVPLQERASLPTASTREMRESPWLPHESCKCKGTGWVCQDCHGAMWVQVQGKASPCARCTVTNSGAVTPQPWREAFQNQRNGKATPAGSAAANFAPLPDRARLDAERKRRAAERAAVKQEWDDDWETERVYAEELGEPVPA